MAGNSVDLGSAGVGTPRIIDDLDLSDVKSAKEFEAKIIEANIGLQAGLAENSKGLFEPDDYAKEVERETLDMEDPEGAGDRALLASMPS